MPHYANLDLHSAAAVGKITLIVSFALYRSALNKDLLYLKSPFFEKGMKGQIFKLFPAKKLASNWSTITVSQ